jgi:hypothetical protein
VPNATVTVNAGVLSAVGGPAAAHGGVRVAARAGPLGLNFGRAGGPATTALAVAGAGLLWPPVGPPATISIVLPAWSNPGIFDDCTVFERLRVDHLTYGATRVEWSTGAHVDLVHPVSYQLEVADAGTVDADWAPAGAPVVDQDWAFDVERRFDGMQLTTHYRVAATDANGLTVRSRPQLALAPELFRDWLSAREIARQHRLRLSIQGGSRGFLLKRRRQGPRCTVCVDPATRDTTNSRCPTCYGTGFTGGYYPPVPSVFADLTPGPADERLNAGPTGRSRVQGAQGFVLATPMLSSGDVWVDGVTDERYYIDTIRIRSRMRSVPVLLDVAMSLLSPNHVVYTFPLGGG